MVLTFLLQTATKLSLKTTVHQEKSEAEKRYVMEGVRRELFPPSLLPLQGLPTAEAAAQP